MPEIFPSQITDFIVRVFPFVERELDGENVNFTVRELKWGVIEALVWMIERLPQYLLIGDNYVEFLSAMGEVRAVIKAWENNSDIPVLRELTKRHTPNHPLTVIYNYLKSCPDEGPLPKTNELQFITDPDFREILRIDISAANQALANGGWKAATVLAGSVIEALLLWVLQLKEKQDSKEFKKAKTEFKAGRKKLGKKVPPSNINQWNLEEYIGLSLELKLISEEIKKSCDLTRDFRNLIHPGCAERKKKTCDRGTALTALGAVEHVITDFEKQYKASAASP